jgi:hypothetical protein
MGRRTTTIALLAAGAALLVAALLWGVSDDPVGIGLCYGATGAFLLALAHRWRTPKPWLVLAAGSALAFVPFVVLHNVLYGLAELASDVVLLRQLLEALHAAFFLAAVLGCPAGLVVGLGGAIVRATTARSRVRPEA